MTNGKGVHSVNAVGLSFEEKRGEFPSIFFYDDEMEHPEDQIMHEDDKFVFKYWPDDLDNQEWRWKPKIPKTVHDGRLLDALTATGGNPNRHRKKNDKDGENDTFVMPDIDSIDFGDFGDL